MGEEGKMSAYQHNGGEDERILEWEEGLPDVSDLTPLSQSLIPPELASAFSITPVPHRTAVDVNRASRDTLSTLRTGRAQSTINNGYNSECGNNNNTDNNNNINSFRSVREPMVIEADNDGSGSVSGSDPRKYRKVVDCAEEADSAVRADNSDDPSARTVKRPRLVWTPQLHKRFVDVVAHLGIKNAVPKTIMQLMNVEGLTRENVASHLQKYRLYLKRMQGLSNEGPSSSDQLFASTPVPQSLHESGGSASGGVGGATGGMNGLVGVQIPVPYGTQVMPGPMYGHMGMHQGGFHQQNGFEGNAYGMMQPRDWSGNKYGSVMYQHHVAPSDQ